MLFIKAKSEGKSDVLTYEKRVCRNVNICNVQVNRNIKPHFYNTLNISSKFLANKLWDISYDFDFKEKT